MRLYAWLLLLNIGVTACQWKDQVLRINPQSTIVYRGAVTPKEAKRLGAFLLQQGYFNSYDKRQVYVRKSDNMYTVTFFIETHLFKEDKENILVGFRVWHTWLKEQVFPHSLVALELADDTRKQLANLSP